MLKSNTQAVRSNKHKAQSFREAGKITIGEVGKCKSTDVKALNSDWEGGVANRKMARIARPLAHRHDYNTTSTSGMLVLAAHNATLQLLSSIGQRTDWTFS